MATRPYDFVTAITSGSAPTPSTPSSDYDTIYKSYADSTYAALSSWYASQADVAAVKAIGSSTRANGMVVLIRALGSFWRFDSSSSATGDDVTVIQPTSGTGRWLIASSSGSGSGETLKLSATTQVSTFKAVEALSARDTVGVGIHNGSGSDEFKAFKADADNGAKPLAIGFAASAVTVTQGSYTLTLAGALVSGNVVALTLNGRVYSVTYASSSDATLQALATLLNLDPDVKTATVTVVGGNQTGTDDRVITLLTSNGINGSDGAVELNFTSIGITGGASQTTLAAATVTAPVQGSVEINHFGPISGFSGMTPGAIQYSSTTAGGITETPPSAGFITQLGVALSSSVLMAQSTEPITNRFSAREMLLKVSGLTNATTYNTPTAAVEAFNFQSWAALANYPGTTFVTTHFGGEPVYDKGLHVIDYATSSGGAATLDHRRYRGGSWSSLTNNATPLVGGSAYQLAGKLYVNQGGTAGHGVSGASARSDAWTGSWANLTAWAGGYVIGGCFVRSNVLSMLGGRDSASSYSTVHETMTTGESKSTSTVTPVAMTVGGAGSGGSNASVGRIMHAINGSNTTNCYTWSGSWSSIEAAATSAVSGQNRFCGYQRSASKNFAVGGGTGAAILTANDVNNTQSWAAGTACSTGSAAGAGGIAS